MKKQVRYFCNNLESKCYNIPPPPTFTPTPLSPTLEKKHEKHSATCEEGCYFYASYLFRMAQKRSDMANNHSPWISEIVVDGGQCRIHMDLNESDGSFCIQDNFHRIPLYKLYILFFTK